MGAVWLRFRAEVRARWRAWLGLALLVGLAAGAVLTLVAGARRTDSAYGRFLREQRAFDALVVNYEEDGTAIYDLDEVARLPQVADAARAKWEYVAIGAVGGTPGIAGLDNRIGTEINRFKVLAGRRANPERADELVVGMQVAEDSDLEVGSTVEIVPAPLVEVIESGRIDRALELFGPEDPTPEEIAAFPGEIEAIRRFLEEVPGGRARVVGIVAAPAEVPPQFQIVCCVHHTPAFARINPNDEHEVLMIRLRRGAAGFPAFRRELIARGGDQPPQLYGTSGHVAGVERSIDVQAAALWLLAGLVLLVGALILLQLLARLSRVESDDHLTLAALGMTHGQRWCLGLARATAIGLVGGVVAVVVAVALSPIFPNGIARTVESDAGVAVDVSAFAVGLPATVLLVVALAGLPAWLAARAVTEERASAGHGGSRVASALPREWMPPSAAAGARMALERGAGLAAVPIATSLAAITLGLAVVVGSLTFNASLDHLVDTPRVYGVAWDLAVWNGGGEAEVAERLAPVAKRRRDVVGVSTGGIETSVSVAGTNVGLVSYDALSGRALPPVVEGRVPSRRGDVALGATTLRELGAEIGDILTVRARAGAGERLRIVGRAVLPAWSDEVQLGRGGFATGATVARLDDEPVEAPALFVSLAADADPGRVLAAFRAEACDEAAFCDVFPLPFGEPDDIVNFGRLQSTPLILAAILAALAAGTLAHVLVSTARRRRRDLAVLKTLGFTRRQVSAVVAAHATFTTAIALLIGVPVGVAIGRALWTIRADDLGIVNEPKVSVLGLAVLIPAAVALANVIAALPARTAARTQPAVVLRSE